MTTRFIELHYASNGQELHLSPSVIARMHETKRHFYEDGSSTITDYGNDDNFKLRFCAAIVMNFRADTLYVMESTSQILALIKESERDL